MKKKQDNRTDGQKKGGKPCQHPPQKILGEAMKMRCGTRSMPSNTKISMYNQGDIVWVKYPFSDQLDKAKTRPAIVISNSRSNVTDNDFLICPITSTPRAGAFSYPLSRNDTQLPLPQPSEVRCNKIFTVRNTLILDKITNMKPKTNGQMNALMLQMIALEK